MFLGKCATCGNNLSMDAEVCYNCGSPRPGNNFELNDALWNWILAPLGLMFFFHAPWAFVKSLAFSFFYMITNQDISVSFVNMWLEERHHGFFSWLISGIFWLFMFYVCYIHNDKYEPLLVENDDNCSCDCSCKKSCKIEEDNELNFSLQNSIIEESVEKVSTEKEVPFKWDNLNPNGSY